MSRRPRPDHSPAFNVKLLLPAIKARTAVAELDQHFDVQFNPIYRWKSQRLVHSAGAF